MMMQQEFLKFQKKLIETIGKESLAIVFSNKLKTRNNDVDYPFRQDSNFYYLTEFPESDAVAVFLSGQKEVEYILYCQEANDQASLWTGDRIGLESAKKDYAATEARPITSFFEDLSELLKNRRKIYYPFGCRHHFERRLQQTLTDLRHKISKDDFVPHAILDIQDIVGEWRLIKTDREIDLMRKAANVTVLGHLRAMKACKPDMTELQLASELHYGFAQAGCEYTAYPTIVGGGANACVLHYGMSADYKLKSGELVLIDAGAEYKNYASDVTRTFPVDGKFTSTQRILYELVLKTQLAVIDCIKPGITWDALQALSEQMIMEELLALGILKGDINKLKETKAVKRFYPHGIGHWLGLDVHDVGKYKINGEWRRLEPGMVLTVEPGVYIRPDSTIEGKWWHIGIRIEDDVLVTERGCEVLSRGIPKEIEAIESMIGSDQ